VTRRPLSIHTRLTLWYAGALLAILIVISGLSYSLLAWSLAQDVDRSLLTVAEVVRDASRSGERLDVASIPTARSAFARAACAATRCRCRRPRGRA